MKGSLPSARPDILSAEPPNWLGAAPARSHVSGECIRQIQRGKGRYSMIIISRKDLEGNITIEEV
jgi:hypothetical protein